MSLIAALLLAAAPAAQAASAATPAPNDYRQDAAWLCRPGRADACAINQDVTVVNADGTTALEPFRAADKPKLDCFYVYPTVSLDATDNSDMTAGAEERLVAAAQAARFAAGCRVFAPLYRQVTLPALRKLMTGQPAAPDRALAFADVKAAWEDYLARDNKGADGKLRGVILIGHSQGAGMLKELVAKEIETKPDVLGRIAYAMLIGHNVAVPAGRDVGGDLKVMPLCRSAAQTGCVISYVTFRDNAPPPANSRFGKVATPGMAVACTNPAALGGGKVVANAILGARGAGLGSAPQGPWTSANPVIPTGFVRVPGLISAECVSKGGFDYLSVTVNADPADPRTDTIVGDVMFNGQLLPDWGLHLIDMGVVMGDLVGKTRTDFTPQPKGR